MAITLMEGGRGTFVKKSSYTLDDIIDSGEGRWEEMGTLPRNRMRLISRITNIVTTGEKGEGSVDAEFDVSKSFWVFGDHFKDDPVLPGAFELDALLQILGFYIGWSGALGKGRATGHGEGKFTGEILPSARKIAYHVDVTRLLPTRKGWFGVGNGTVELDGNVIYKNDLLQVGVFPRR